MGEKVIKTTPFQSGQQTNAKGTSEPVKMYFKMSKVRNAGQPDALKQALTKPPPTLPSVNHEWTHSKTSKSTGAHYNPAGEWGRPTGKLGSKATNPMGGSGGKGTFRGHP